MIWGDEEQEDETKEFYQSLVQAFWNAGLMVLAVGALVLLLVLVKS